MTHYTLYIKLPANGKYRRLTGFGLLRKLWSDAMVYRLLALYALPSDTAWQLRRVR